MATVIYARKSTESEDRQVQSLDDQVNALTDLAKREGILVDDIITESRSAKTPYSRPEFQRMISRIQAGEIDGVLTWAVNRLNRNLIDGGIIAHLLQTGKLQFIRTPERIYRPEDNVLILSIENGMATSFIQDLSRNVRRGMRGKAERGWMPGSVPIGYTNNPVTHEVEPDPDRFELVRKGWLLLLSGGYTIAEVHRELVALGLKGIQSRTRTKPIARSIIYQTYTNPFYTGVFTFRGEQLPGKHQPMITTAQFEDVQHLLGRASGRRFQRHSHMFAGLLRCGNCGCRVVGDTKRKFYAGTGRAVEYTYYHCTGARGCTKRGLAEQHIAKQFIDAFDRLKIPHSFAEWAMSALLHVAESDSVFVEQSVSRIDQDLLAAERRLGRIREMRVDNELSAGEYADMKGAEEQNVARLKKEKADLVNENERLMHYIERKLEIAERASNYEQLSSAAQRGLILGMGTEHCLTLDKLTIHLDPILRQIAGFGPLRNGSEIPKPGDFSKQNLDWLGLVDSIRTVARMELRRQPSDGRTDGVGTSNLAA